MTQSDIAQSNAELLRVGYENFTAGDVPAVLGTERDRAERHIVTARLDGDFPASTVVLRHDFTLAGHRIARLVIAP